MTFRPRITLLAASIAFAFAGAAHAQAPAAPTTPAPSSATTPATGATPQAGTTTPASKDRTTKKGAPTAPKSGAPTGTPGVAAAPGAAPSGAQAAKPERSAKRSNDAGGSGRQLQNAYADLMTPEEMAAHKAKVKQTKTYAECKSLFEATGKEMEARAKAQNKSVKASPTEICDRAKERGRLTG